MRPVQQLEHVRLLAEYENLLTIDWGTGTRAWHQKGSNLKSIISIQADSKKVFCGFEGLILSFDELQSVIEQGNTDYSDWRTALSSIYAIYLMGSISNTDGLFFVYSGAILPCFCLFNTVSPTRSAISSRSRSA